MNIISESRRDAWSILRRLALEGSVSCPMLPEVTARRAHNALDSVVAFADHSPAWARNFNLLGADWKQRQRPGLGNSGYFAPYYRDRNGQAHADQKVIYQTCHNFIRERQPDQYPNPADSLDTALRDVMGFCEPYMFNIVRLILTLEPELASHFFDQDGRPLLAARALRYSPDGLAATNPHVDKSALSCVIHTTDSGRCGVLGLGAAWPSTLRTFGLSLPHQRSPRHWSQYDHFRWRSI